MTEEATGRSQPTGLAQWALPPKRTCVKDVRLGDGSRLRFWSDREADRVVIQIDGLPRSGVVTTLDAEGDLALQVALNRQETARLASILRRRQEVLQWTDDQ